MIQCNTFYDIETNETTVEYYWFDNNNKRHGDFSSCFDALESLENFANDLEESLYKEDVVDQ